MSGSHMTLHQLIEHLQYELDREPQPNIDILLSRGEVADIIAKLRLMKKREMKAAIRPYVSIQGRQN